MLDGPYASGKSALFEELLFAAGAIDRRGTVKDGMTVGDASDEARSRSMPLERPQTLGYDPSPDGREPARGNEPLRRAIRVQKELRDIPKAGRPLLRKLRRSLTGP